MTEKTLKQAFAEAKADIAANGPVMKKSLSDLMLQQPPEARASNDFFATSGVRDDITEFSPSMTRQEFAAECDINTIMAQYEKHGVISHINPVQPMFLDLTNQPRDLAEALQIMNDATASFMSLPAKVRKEFDNDPVQFVDFAQDEKNVEKLREWGLAKPLEAPAEPLAVRVIPDPAPPPGDAPKPA